MDGAAPAPLNLHATCVLLGEVGILIRGGAGSGKSTLARQLLAYGEQVGCFAALVSDDRVNVARLHGRLLARAIPAIAGQLEIRGLGIVQVAAEPAAIIRILIDCEVPATRMPNISDLSDDLLGVTLPRIAVGRDVDSLALTLWRWRVVCDTPLTEL